MAKDSTIIAVFVIVLVMCVIAAVRYDLRYATVSDVKSIIQERLDRIEAKLDELLKGRKQ